MQKLYASSKALWGKKKFDKDKKQEFWLPLVAHLTDTRNIMTWLYTNWISSGTKRLLCQNISDEDMKKLVGFLGFFHDFGKATPAFQYKESHPLNRDLDSDIQEKLIRAGFTELHLPQRDFKFSPHPIAGEALLESYGLNKFIGSIIGGHHGFSPDEEYVNRQIENYTFNILGNDHDPDIQSQWKKVQKNIYEYGLDLCGYQDISEVPIVDRPQAVILEGMLIMADWFASSEYFTKENNIELFPLINVDKELDSLDLTKRYHHAVDNWDVTDRWNPQSMPSPVQAFKQRFNFTPRPVQEKMCEYIDQLDDPGMVIIEAPTGIGKTELALAAAEQLAFKMEKNGLYIGLPTQATTNAMFSRVESWLKSIAKQQEENPDIKLLQGKAKFNPDYRKLPRAENVDIEQDYGEVVVNNWFSGKKSSLSHFAVGTIDNLLLLGLKQKHLYLRHLGFSDKVVIIDEVHAYDVYMSSYLKKALEWLGAYHVPVIALSATLPIEKRNELLKAYAKGKYNSKVIAGSANWQQNEAYPLLSMLDGQEVKQVTDFVIPEDEKREVNIVRFKGNEQDIVNKALAEINEGGVAGIIVNTVKRAQDIARLIPQNINKLVLHSEFLASEREQLEDKLQKAIGKNAKRPEKMIVIGTQVLEQSLDIDFDVLFTDIAPMDLIIQRIGRLHRHNINRPKAFAKPQAYITAINEFGDYGKGNEFIYGDYLLMKTDYFLKNKIMIPEDVSTLVQAVYNKDNDDEIKGIQEAKDEFEIKIAQLKEKAKHFQIGKPKFKHPITLAGWLKDSQIDVENDNHAAACVRDIQETIEVVLLKRTTDGDYLLDGRSLDSVSSEEIASQTIRLPIAITNNSGKNVPDKISKSIDELEKLTTKNYPNWYKETWLHGVLALTLNEQDETTFNGYRLHYSDKLGLMYEKEDDND